MYLRHIISRSKKRPFLRRITMFGVAMTTSVLLLSVWHSSLTGWTAQEMADFQNVNGPRIRDQLESPPPMTEELNHHNNYVYTRVPGHNTSYADDVSDRRRSYFRQCSTGWNKTLGPNVSSIVYVDNDNDVKMAYCFVAKIGCTFWLRIFTFLTRRDDMHRLGIDSPFDIDRTALHSGKLMTKLRLKFSDFRLSSRHETVRFLFARNPYERLWSVYLDKYYLPDYWFHKPLGSNRCGVNTTFTQFLDAAVTLSDHHLTPVATACNPCAFRPDVIGKMETFARDAKQILDTAGYSSFLDNYNHSSYVEVELKSLLVYNFKRLKGLEKMHHHCLTAVSLCERLWRVFQINGHIKSTIPFPKDRGDYSLESATRMFMETVRNEPMSKEESRRQRRHFISMAYATISPSTITGIQNRYRADFEMFDYDIQPPRVERFSDRQDIVVM